MEDYKVLTNQNKEVQLKAMSGVKGLIIFFYPKAFTSLCSLEVQTYQRKYNNIKEQGFNVIGVSQDLVGANNEFCDSNNLKFPLVSDVDQILVNAFDLKSEIVDLNGVPFNKYERSTFVLDHDLNILKEFRNVSPTTHVDVILDYLKILNKK